jgi:hypothetical protein
MSSSEKTSWSLKTSFWKKNCQTNSKMPMKNFSYERLPCKSVNFMLLRHPSKKSQSMETFTPEKFSWTFFNLLDNFSSKMVFLNDKKSFQSLRSEYSLKIWKFSDIFYFTDLMRQTKDKKIPRTILKIRLKTKVYFCFRKIPCGLIPKPLNVRFFTVFGRFIENYLRNLTCWE